MTVGQRIRAAREKKGFTQRYVAQKSGVNAALLQLYEYGKRNPKDDQLKKIADAIGVAPESLRPPKIETETELLYALREISEKFGTVLVEDGGRGIHIRLNQLKFVSEEDESKPADDIKKAQIKCLSQDMPEGEVAKESAYTNNELVIRHARALKSVRLIVKDKTEMIEACLERKDLMAADYHVETLKHTVDLVVQEELNM